VKYARIAEQRKEFGIDEMCSVLDVSESGYRAWQQGGKLMKKRLTDAQMLALIRNRFLAIYEDILGGCVK